MAKFVTTDYSITLGTTDFSSSIAAVTLEVSADEQETTAFGNSFRTRIAGLKDASLTLEWHQDFGADSVDATLWPLLGSEVSFTILPQGGTVSATNPSYSGTALVVQYSPLDSSVGDLATLSTTWPVTGEVTRATA